MVPRSTSPARWRSSSPGSRPPTAGGPAPRADRGRRARSAGPCWCCAGSATAPARLCLARDAGISRAAAYRYLREGIDVLAEKAPDLHRVLHRCRTDGMSHLVLDGTLIGCDRAAGVRENGDDLWYPGKTRRFAGNIQFLAAPDGTPHGASPARRTWGRVSDVEPGSTPDTTAARRHALPALADLGYQGAGIGVRTPTPPQSLPTGPARPPLHTDNRTHDRLLRGLRAPGERAAATLTQRWRALQHVTLSPSRVGAIARAALVLNQNWK